VDDAEAWRVWNRGGTVYAASEELSTLLKEFENGIREFVEPENHAYAVSRQARSTGGMRTSGLVIGSF
jgi:hypothetical protein